VKCSLITLITSGLDSIPDFREAVDVLAEVLLRGSLGGRPHDDTETVGANPGDDLAEPLPFVLGEAPADPAHVRSGSEHQVPAGKAYLIGEARPLVAHRILDHLDQDFVADLQGLLDASTALGAGVDGDIPRIEHAVLWFTEIDEGGLHAGEDVADLADVDVVGKGEAVFPGHIVLHQQCALQHHQLGLMRGPTDQHLLPVGLRGENDLRLWAVTPVGTPLPGRFRRARRSRGLR